MSRFIDIHVLQTLPPSNPNRDDTGAPKTATFGGVRRMRISSQAIKRATREDFEKLAPEGNRGIRTKLVVELVRAAIVERAPQLAQSAAELAEMGLVEIGFKLTEPKRKKNEETTDQKLKEAGFLVFLSAKQIEHLAENNRPKGDRYDTLFDGVKADLKSTRSHNNIAKYGKKAFREQGADMVVYRLEEHTEGMLKELKNLKELFPDKRIVYYYQDEQRLREL